MYHPATINKRQFHEINHFTSKNKKQGNTIIIAGLLYDHLDTLLLSLLFKISTMISFMIFLILSNVILISSIHFK